MLCVLVGYLFRTSSSLAIDITRPFSSGLRSMRPVRRNRRISSSPVGVVSIDGFTVCVGWLFVLVYASVFSLIATHTIA